MPVISPFLLLSGLKHRRVVDVCTRTSVINNVAHYVNMLKSRLHETK